MDFSAMAAAAAAWASVRDQAKDYYDALVLKIDAIALNVDEIRGFVGTTDVTGASDVYPLPAAGNGAVAPPVVNDNAAALLWGAWTALTGAGTSPASAYRVTGVEIEAPGACQGRIEIGYSTDAGNSFTSLGTAPFTAAAAADGIWKTLPGHVVCPAGSFIGARIATVAGGGANYTAQVQVSPDV